MDFFILFIIILCIKDVQSSVNVAKDKTTDYSSIHSSMNFVSENAVDGNTNQIITYCFHTSEVQQNTAWLRVDLGEINQIENVTIYYRDEGGVFLRRFMGYELYLSNISTTNGNSGKLCYSNVGRPTPSTVEAHRCDYLARYVTVYKDAQNGDDLTRGTEGAILEICEFEIYGCPVGYFGNNNCNSNCSGCPQQMCDPTNGICKETGFCELGFYVNNTCNRRCPHNCRGSKCDLMTGDCAECVDGFYGSRCSMTCPADCLTGTCNFTSGHCFACKKGLYGLRCDMTCSTGCLFGSCAFESGRCTGDVCVDGFYGIKCDKSCPTNCNTTHCDFQSGTCEGCVAGFYGSRCELPCPANCLTDTCDFQTGQCDGCAPGFYGVKCRMRCPNCLSGMCDFLSGSCDACVSGYYGGKCDRKCPSGCRSSCNFSDGTCDACKNQLYGPTCSESCVTCRGNCGSTGVCLLGCIDGWEGQKCDMGVKDNTTTIVTVVLVIILAGILAAVIFVIQRKRRQHKSTYGNDKQVKEEYTNVQHSSMTGTSTVESKPRAGSNGYSYTNQSDNLYGNLGTTTMNSIVSMISRKLTDGSGIIDKEFKALPYGSFYPHKASDAEQNLPKNRYKTTYAYDHSRVKLVYEYEDENNDYINANYINGVGELKTYIAAQGPKPNTVNDFWQMIWQEDSGKIVMLTNLTENGKRKCNMYWPEEGKPLITKSFTVTILEEKQYSFYTIRRLQISSKLSPAPPARVTVQFHFTNWPDHGTPDCQELIQFHRRVIQWKSQLHGPTVVHCSAGIGRTGTYIGLDALYSHCKKTRTLDIRGYVEAMRKDRMNMIQTTDQYTFLHEVLTESLIVPDTLYSKFEFINRYSDLGNQSVLETIDEEHQVLMTTQPSFDSSKHRISLREENRDRNVTNDILAADRYRVFVNRDVDGNDYINAIRVPSYVDGIGYIVTHIPQSTVEHFWTMVKDCNVSTIVVLEKANSTSWLPLEDKPLTFKTCTVRDDHRKSDIDSSSIVQSECIVSGQSSQTDNKVSVIKVLDIDTDITPSSSVNPFLMLLDIISSRVINEDHQIVIMCRDGAALSGLICLLSNVRQQLVTDAEVDILQAARRLQNRRPQFIQSLDQYEFCFKATLKIINMLEVYQND